MRPIPVCPGELSVGDVSGSSPPLTGATTVLVIKPGVACVDKAAESVRLLGGMVPPLTRARLPFTPLFPSKELVRRDFEGLNYAEHDSSRVTCSALSFALSKLSATSHKRARHAAVGAPAVVRLKVILPALMTDARLGGVCRLSSL